MTKPTLTEKYESNGWPSIARPDLKPPAGWSLPLLSAVNRVRNHALAPDGETIAFIWDREDQSDIYTLRPGSWPQRLTFDRQPVAYWSDGTPAWSPDGQWLAYGANGHIWVVPADGRGLPTKISGFATGASSPAWLPDSHGLLISIEYHDASQLLLSDREGSWPRPLVTRRDGDCWEAAPTANGEWAVYTFRPFNDLRRTDIQMVHLASGCQETVAGWPQVVCQQPKPAPTDDRIAFVCQKSGWLEIWLATGAGNEPRQLTRFHADVGYFAWSPDGRQLVATVNQAGSYHLVLIDAETGTARTLLAGDGYHSRPNWSPDGSWLTVEYEDPILPPDIYRISLSGERRQLTYSQLPALAAANFRRPELVSYKSSDGLEIPAFLYRPEKSNGAAILYPHGGPSSQYVQEWDVLVQYFLAKGYTWLCPNYRGSTGYGLDFERANYNDWGGGDFQDCLAGGDYLADLPEIDPAKIAIYGASYGGYMVACALSRDPSYRFACGVDKFGDANLVSSWAQCNRDLRLYSEIFLGHPAGNQATYRAGSPIYDVDNVQKPVLILHGLEDDVVPPEASEEWVAALRRAGKTYEYKTYATEPHGFLKRTTQQDAYARIERFLDWHLLPGV